MKPTPHLPSAFLWAVVVLLATIGGITSGRAADSTGVVPFPVYGFPSGVATLQDGVVPGPGGIFYGVSRSGGALGTGAFFSIDNSGTVTVLASFGEGGTSTRGRGPTGQLVYDGSVWLYGVTERGGAFDRGTVFRAKATGEVETLVDFSGTEGAAPGAFPKYGLARAKDGNLYGVYSSSAGHNTTATAGVFRVSDAGRYQRLFEFTGKAGAFPGDNPQGPLLALEDGTLIGTTGSGGAANRGTIFRVDQGGTYSLVAAFTRTVGPLQGGEPFGTLVQLENGDVYGIGRDDGASDFGFYGFVWRLPNGGQPSVLRQFTVADPAANPVGGVASAPGSGVLAVLTRGGPAGNGGVYRIDPTGSVTLYQSFDTVIGDADPKPTSGLLSYMGFYFGTSTQILYRLDGSLATSLAKSTPDAGTNFGTGPVDSLLFGQGNTIYVRTQRGGANGRGTIFMIPGTGGASALASLPQDHVASEFGADPLVQTASGSILVVARSGGPSGGGRILRIDGSGVITTAVDFNVANLSTTGAFPQNGLIGPDSLGDFYGQAVFETTTTPTKVVPGHYRLTSTYQVVQLGLFDSSNAVLSGPVLPISNTTYLGVVGSKLSGIYQLSDGGLSAFSRFTSPSLGEFAVGPPCPEPSGSYLVQSYQVPSTNGSSIVRVGATGTAQRIAALSRTAVAGADQFLAPLALDGGGNIYSVFRDGGAAGGGIIVRIEPSGKSSIVYEFPFVPGTDQPGINPISGLKPGPDGALYGVTSIGGPFGGGAVYKIFVQPVSSAATGTTTLIDANTVVLNGEVTNNGFAGEYWFTYDTVPPSATQETSHIPTAGFHGSQTVSVSVTGLKGHSTYTATLHARIGTAPEVVGSPVSFTTDNGAPVANDDGLVVDGSAPSYIVAVLANDIDLDGDGINVVSANDGAFGTVAVNTDGTITYTPGPGFVDVDSFTYKIADDFGGAGGGLTAEARVNVVRKERVLGTYAGLLFEVTPSAAGLPREVVQAAASGKRAGAAARLTADQIAAGFASFSVSGGGAVTGKFDIDGKSVSARGSLAQDRHSTLTGSQGFNGQFTVLPDGFTATVSFGGRTLVLVAGRGYSDGVPPPVPISDFTMRFSPTEDANPVAVGGVPAGTGFAVIRKGQKSRRTIVGVLPDGTAFTARSVVDTTGQLPFLARLYKRTGSIDGQLLIGANGDIDAAPNSEVHWIKPASPRDKRFPDGFNTTLSPFGGTYTVPGKNDEPLGLADGSTVEVIFDRGGLFEAVSTGFMVTGAKFTPAGPGSTASAKVSFTARTGLFTGTFKLNGKSTKYRGAVVQRDPAPKATGHFLGSADTGVVEIDPQP